MKRKMKNKRAIELSVNFLVILIISIAVFSGAIALTYKLFSKVKTGEEELNQAQKLELQRLLAGGSRVAIPLNSLEVRSGKSGTINVGILNNLGYNAKFQISVAVGSAYKPDGTTPIQQAGNYIKMTYVKERTINNNNQDFFPIGVAVDNKAVSGTYIVNVKITYKDSAGATRDYDTLKKVYVQVV